ncbi:hypothetical protein KFL_001100130 [Klebsormidium nitens]|uniref:MYND-type domain-containing protein n=1 Tax=Klebsormidium nitens TaxID=105231 RepID=A0A1Y1HYX8_KLENI|nr:hypothetical protein KFL_001100130 [Klebsormidium nitens]|eukprot:GAQ82399.1 hypothetical protein KFL_001100130 [Klebsormidium nitens]
MRNKKAGLQGLVAIMSEMDSRWAESVVRTEEDIWPEKDILMWESVVSSYELVLQRRKIKIKPVTRKERLRILRQCHKFYTADYGPFDQMQLERLVHESCQAIYEERKYVLQEAVNKTKALLALVEFCQLCRKHNVGFRHCGRCKAVKYCSEMCQKEDWNRERGHRAVCNAIQRGDLRPENVLRLKINSITPAHAANALVPMYWVTYTAVRES